jgi:phosphoglucosamine mutase
LSALQILRVLVDTGRPLSELRRCLTRYPQKLVSLRVREKIPLAEIPAMQPLLRDLEARLAGQGRLVVRYSGTENKIRLLIEAGEGHNLDSLLEPVIHGLRTTIGAT